MLFYLLFLNIEAAIVTNPFPDIFLYTNETYTIHLLNYFKGINLSFEVNTQIPSDSITFTTSSNLTLHQTQFLPFPNLPSDLPQKLSVTENPSGFNILSLSNTTLLLFFVSNLDISVQVLLNQSLSDQIPNATIEQGVLTPSNILILITRDESVEEYTFRRYDVVYCSIGETSLSLASCGWDFRYFEGILMSSTDCEFVAFGISGQEDQSAGIYVYSFENADCPILVQVIERFYTIPEYLSLLSFPDPIDLIIVNDRLLVLNSNGILVIFSFNGETFSEEGFSNLSEFGPIEYLSVSLSTPYTELVCSITSPATVINYDVGAFSKLSYITSSLSPILDPTILYSQTEAQYTFFSTTSNKLESFFEIAEFRLEGIQHLASINMNEFSASVKPFGHWVVLPGNNFRILIREDFDGVRLFNLTIPDYLLYVSSSESRNVTIIAEDSEGAVSNTMQVDVFEDISVIYFVNGYYDADSFISDRPVYFLGKTQTSVVNILSLVSGWNLTYEVGENFTDIYNYTLEKSQQVVLWRSLNVGKEFVDGGFYGNMMFLIDYQGVVYKNSSVLLPNLGAERILPLSDVQADVAILYPMFIAFCYHDTPLCDEILLNISCEVFKTVEDFVICASNDILQVIVFDEVVVEIEGERFGVLGSIKDAAFSSGDDDALGYCVYMLTGVGLYVFQIVEGEIALVRFLEIEGDFVFYDSGLVAIIEDRYLSVYSKFLEMRMRHFEMLTGYEIVIQHDEVLIVLNDNYFYLYDISVPTINSLISSYYIGTCILKSVTNDKILFNCSNEMQIFNSTCYSFCGKLSAVNFHLTNIENTNKGSYTAILPLNVTNGNLTYSIYLTFILFTYGSTVFFDNSSVSFFSLSYEYNIQTSLDLKYYVNGYSVNTNLMINGKTVNESDKNALVPANLVNRSWRLNRTEFDEVIIDYTIVEYTTIVLSLTENRIIVVNNSRIITSFSISDSGLANSTCTAIDYIQRNSENAAFVCYCKEIYQFPEEYYNGKRSYTIKYQPILFLFTFSLSTFTLISSNVYPLSYNLDWLRILNGPGTRFILLCISSNEKNSEVIDQDITINNEVFVYKGTWTSNVLKINQELKIDFFSLNVEYFHASFIDGVFNGKAKSSSKDLIYLYIADSFFGIRAIKLYNSTLEILQNVKFPSDRPVSLTVCHNFLFVFTFETFFIQYIITPKYLLNYYVTYPASPVSEYIGINSVASCSNYYIPKYVNLYLKNINDLSKYILRVMNLDADFNSSVHKDFTIHCDELVSLRMKSLFMGQDTISYLSNNFKTLEIAKLGNVELRFNSMDDQDYEKMVKEFGSDKFELVIRAYNREFSVESKVFELKRTGPSGKKESDSVDVTMIVVAVVVGIVTILIFISVFMYKKVVKRKRSVPKGVRHNFSISPFSLNSSRSFYLNSSS